MENNNTNLKVKAKGKRNIKKIVLNILLFLVCEAVFFSLASFILVFHGPFTKLKENYVVMAMTTMRHQYLAKMFVSQKEIDEIMARNATVVSNVQEKLDEVIVPDKEDKGIEIVEIKESKFNGKLMIVNDPKRIRLGIPTNYQTGGAPLSQIVKQYGAVGGINAGGFKDAAGATPEGILIADGITKYVNPKMKYFDIIGFNKNKKLVIKKSLTEEKIKKEDMDSVICFGPALILNGEKVVKSGIGLQPRSVIGQRKDGTVLLLAINGRYANKSNGATLNDIANIMLRYKAYNAANLDGGSSTTMVYQNKVINTPCDIMGERSIPSAFIVMP